MPRQRICAYYTGAQKTIDKAISMHENICLALLRHAWMEKIMQNCQDVHMVAKHAVNFLSILKVFTDGLGCIKSMSYARMYAESHESNTCSIHYYN